MQNGPIEQDPADASSADDTYGATVHDDAEKLADEDIRNKSEWFTDDDSDAFDGNVKEYDITASPNDFNLSTIVNFIDKGPFKVPGFQRNYVWDLKKASKLIESIMIGLPVPQVFLYENGKNSFLVIDGQQRLMSIFYFVKQRFPRREKRPAIRRIVAEKGFLPSDVLNDDQYFSKFNLSLMSPDGSKSKFHGKNYETLGDDRTTFDLRTVRNVIIKQNSPDEDSDSSVFEIFNRLNTGGVNLRPQEIRASMYHSNFLSVLDKINLNSVWRELIGQEEPDLHAKDTEVLLRSIAMAIDGDNYVEPLSRFLNNFARKAKSFDESKLDYISTIFETFFSKITSIRPGLFRVDRSGRFSIAIFEAVFRAMCTDAVKSMDLTVHEIDETRLENLKKDTAFIDATKEGIGRAIHVRDRFDRAVEILTK